jgi:hypothetical protein
VGLLNTFCCGSGAGFDISGVTGTAYFASEDILFTINLQTGLATQIGTIGRGEFTGQATLGLAAPVGGVQLVPEPTSLTLFGAGLVGLGLLGLGKQGIMNRNCFLSGWDCPVERAHGFGLDRVADVGVAIL